MLPVNRGGGGGGGVPGNKFSHFISKLLKFLLKNKI